MSELVKAVQDGVVSVAQAQFEVDVSDLLQASLVPQGVGTGIVIDDQGHIVTNFHVIRDAAAVIVTSRDGTIREAQIVGEAPDFDIALLRVDNAEGLRPLPIGSSAEIEVGDPVVAIGNALGLDPTAPTVSAGIVSAKNRTISTIAGVLQGLLQTDAAINPGNSGGPLLNQNGEVVGVNTAVAAGDAQNVVFAIGIDGVMDLVRRFIEGKGGAYLGAQLLDNTPRRDSQFRLGVPRGALVVSVTAGPGAASGLQPGDVVVEANGVEIRTAGELHALIARSAPGDQVELQIIRQRERIGLTLTVGQRPLRVN